MKISLYEFLALPDQKQYSIVFNEREGKKRYVLYAVDLFFVEVEYDSEINKIRNNRAFVSGKILDRYSFF